MEIPIYQVDAFASALFRGNPAAVCPLDRWLPDATLLAIAAENNLAETAFYVPEDGGYHLRWFTPTVEVPLCGHATLATAVVMFESRKEVRGPVVRFSCRSGSLTVERKGDLYQLDFPARKPSPAPVSGNLLAGIGIAPVETYSAVYNLLVFDHEDQIRALDPDMAALAREEPTICTAPGSDCDFVSRFFAPSHGIPEDPVTGSAHSALIPYWSARLGKKQMFARQISARGGELWVEDRGDRVAMAGRGAIYLQGTIFVPEA